MKQQTYWYRKWLFLPLFVAMILSGIRAEPVAAYANTFPSDTPPKTEKLRQIAVMPYRDALTAEILGRKNAQSIIACSIRNRGKTIYQKSDSGLLTDVSAFSFPSLCTASALRRRNRQPYVRSWIIRYIHDQDGEKDGAFSS